MSFCPYALRLIHYCSWDPGDDHNRTALSGCIDLGGVSSAERAQEIALTVYTILMLGLELYA